MAVGEFPLSDYLAMMDIARSHITLEITKMDKHMPLKNFQQKSVNKNLNYGLLQLLSPR